MQNNVYIKCLDGIVKEAYAHGETMKYDWQTAIDIFDAKHHVSAAIGDPGEAARQRSEFLNYVKGKKFAPDGIEIKEKPELSDEYMINGKKVKITGDMIDD